MYVIRIKQNYKKIPTHLSKTEIITFYNSTDCEIGDTRTFRGKIRVIGGLRGLRGLRVLGVLPLSPPFAPVLPRLGVAASLA
jgi:hypothetical protein